MNQGTAISKAQAYLAQTDPDLIPDTGSVWRNDPQGLWLVGYSSKSRPDDVLDGSVVGVWDDGTVDDVSSSQDAPEWQGVEFPEPGADEAD